MPRFTVSCDLLVPVLLEIEAQSEESAIDVLHEMRRSDLLKLADTSDSAIGIVNGSETCEESP